MKAINNPQRTTCSVWRAAVLVVSFLSLQACNVPFIKQDLPHSKVAELLNGKELLGNNAENLSLPEHDILAMDATMADFVDRYVPRRGDDGIRLNILDYAMLAPGILGMEYKFDAINTARQAFDTGQANCLSYAHLFIALSRYAGFKTSYQEVKLPPTWAEIKATGSYYYLRHVNVNLRFPHRQYTVDINAPKEIKFLKAKRISDHEAFAQHFNNIAVKYMQEGDKLNAFRNFKKAIILAPKDASLWANFGTLYRRYGFYKLAETAYYHALYLNEKEYTAMSSLAGLYLLTGESDKREYYLKKVERIRKQNPYNYFYLARKAYKKGDYSLAQKRLSAAISKEKGDLRFYLLMVLVQQKLNNNEAVLKYQKIAEELSGEIEQYMSNMMNDLD